MKLFGFTLSRTSSTPAMAPIVIPTDPEGVILPHVAVAQSAAPPEVKSAASVILSGLHTIVLDVEAHPQIITMAAKIVAATAENPSVVRTATTVAGIPF